MSDGDFVDRPATVQSCGMEAYGPLKRRMLECIGRMGRFEGFPHSFLSDLKERLEKDRFNLVVVGQFKRGKTCLINALMGSDLLPVAVVPLTSVVTVLSYGDRTKATVLRHDGESTEVPLEDVASYVTEVGNPKNEKNVREVHIEFPSAYLKDGVRLIDTPGVGSVYQHNTDAAYRYLPHCDAALFLLSVEQPVGRAELDFLRDVQVYSNRIFFLLNKIDILSDPEIEESMIFSRNALEEAMGNQVKMFPVSAKLALQGKAEGSEEVLRRSRLPAFSAILDQFLMQEKGKVLLLSAGGALRRNLRQGRLERELELKALGTPLEELQEKISLFEKKRAEVLAEKDAFLLLAEGETKKIIREVLDADLSAFKNELIAKMEEGFEACHEANKELSLRELSEALRKYVTEGVEREISVWRPLEEEKIERAFQDLCDRSLNKINGILEALLQFSARVFSVPFEAVSTQVQWKMESRFYFKFEEEAVGLSMLESSLTEVFPGYISNRFKKVKDFFFRLANRRIVKKRMEHLYQVIEMQAGRIRSDLVERLNASTAAFRKEMLQKIDSTANGIATAIDKGMRQKSVGEESSRERQQQLLEESFAIDALRKDLLDIEECAKAL